MFYQAEALTSIFIDPTDPAFTHIAQHITQKEVFKLKKLWSSDDKTLKMKDLESIFFPKVSKTSPIQQREYKTSSQVTGKDYSHGRTILTRASDEEYGKIFDRLAGHAQARTSVPPSLDWTSLAAPTQETGKLTNDILHHVISWFDSENHRKGAAKNLPLQWIDRLEAGPLANRGGPNDGVLMHTDKSSKEATRLLVQALFDKIREFHKLEDDWTKLVSLLLFHESEILIRQGSSNSARVLYHRELFPNAHSASMLSIPLSISRMGPDPAPRQKLHRLSIQRSHGYIQRGVNREFSLSNVASRTY